MRLELDYEYITTVDLQGILKDLRRVRYSLQPYRKDPLRIKKAKLGDSWIEVVIPLLVGAGIEVLKYVAVLKSFF